jgi:toxin-antitoxin system PIN domain toxin
MDIPDVNVWLAFTDSRHAFHLSARKYWEELREDDIAFCRITMLGLMRLATHKKVMQGKPFTNQEIWDIYKAYRSMPIVHFLNEPQGIESHFCNCTNTPSFLHRLWTDGYIASFAMASGCRVVTFDGDFSRFEGLNVLILDQTIA